MKEVGKGHRYCHMVHAIDGTRGAEILFIGEGRKEKDFESGLEKGEQREYFLR